MKTLFVILTVLFLFGGMVVIGLYMSHSNNDGTSGTTATDLSSTSAQYDQRKTMKQIDSLTANLNLSFTSVNGKGISPQSVKSQKITRRNL